MSMSHPPVIYWLRRDLRLADNPALLAALKAAGEGGVLPLFIVDERIVKSAGPTRVQFLHDSLRALNESMGNRLVVRYGSPLEVLRTVMAESGATQIFVTQDFAPLGIKRDDAIRRELSSAQFHAIGTPYIVPPGSIFSKSNEPFKVFTAFRRVWDTFEIARPLDAPVNPTWFQASSDSLDGLTAMAGRTVPDYFGDLAALPMARPTTAGEAEAHRLLESFKDRVDDYSTNRNIPGLDGTSMLSPHLRFGTIHPRQVADALIGDSDDRRVFLSEIAWREFYADVLFNHPQSVADVLQPTMRHLPVDRDAAAEERFRQWARGETGYPLVDAGMRQLLATGWMHNRVRMVAASFLVKHLHLDWRWGAQWFMWRLIDGDIASNQHGWQWAAGTGTDAAPYHRVFNPTLQAERFDADGTYVHTWIPELSSVAAPQCLQPGGGEGLLAPPDYARPMIDAKTERDEALRRFALARELAASKNV
jgi:deoxyribodipyrimidine photo-lyase